MKIARALAHLDGLRWDQMPHKDRPARREEAEQIVIAHIKGDL